MAVFFVLLCVLSRTKLVVNAESANNTTNNEVYTEMEVPVINEKRTGEMASLTHSSPRVVDGIYYTILSIDGEQAYCIQSSKDTPAEAVYEVAKELKGTDSFLNKVMYYAYGNPGYREDIWIADCPGDTTRAYLRSHIVMSYVYDSENTLKREIKDSGWKTWWRNYIEETIEKIKNEPDIPTTDLALERSLDIAYFEKETKVQRTAINVLHGDVRNQITLQLQEGVTLVNVSSGKRMNGEGVISGGDEFYFETNVEWLNGEVTGFYHLCGSLQNEWATLVVKTGTNKQDIGYGVWRPVSAEEISLEVQWIPMPNLDIVKTAAKDGYVYKKGDKIPYHIEVYQAVENAVAKALYIEDRILNEGASILYDTIQITDIYGNIIEDATIAKTDQGFQVCGGKVLEYLEYSESAGIVIEYQVVVESEQLTVVENKAYVRSENAPEDEDCEEVPVEPIPEPEPEPEKAPETGDERYIFGLYMVLLMSVYLFYIRTKRNVDCE